MWASRGCRTPSTSPPPHRLAGTAAHAAVDGTVRVVGATGGVGNQVVQLAARAGAHVIATAHTDEERALVGEFGARETVDYTGDVAAAVRAIRPSGVDAVVHLAGDPAAVLGLVRPAAGSCRR